MSVVENMKPRHHVHPRLVEQGVDPDAANALVIQTFATPTATQLSASFWCEKVGDLGASVGVLGILRWSAVWSSIAQVTFGELTTTTTVTLTTTTVSSAELSPIVHVHVCLCVCVC